MEPARNFSEDCPRNVRGSESSTAKGSVECKQLGGGQAKQQVPRFAWNDKVYRHDRLFRSNLLVSG